MKYLKLAIVFYVVLATTSCKNPKPNNSNDTISNSVENNSIILSADKKIIMHGEFILLKIDDTKIFNWFKTKSGLCSKSPSTSEIRNLFCNDPATFLSKTSFTNIYPTKNNKYVAFEITSEAQLPDVVLGFYNVETKTVNWLTRYYLGNKFLGYSPDESKFIYKNSCWEAMCGLTVKSTDNLITLKDINNPQLLDTRASDAVFNEWIDNNTIHYTLKNHLGSKDYTETF